jgi:hypothetical protein
MQTNSWLTISSTDPFVDVDDIGEVKQTQNYIHIRIQRTFLSSLRSLSTCGSPLSHRLRLLTQGSRHV